MKDDCFAKTGGAVVGDGDTVAQNGPAEWMTYGSMSHMRCKTTSLTHRMGGGGGGGGGAARLRCERRDREAQLMALLRGICQGGPSAAFTFAFLAAPLARTALQTQGKDAPGQSRSQAPGWGRTAIRGASWDNRLK